MNFIHIKQRAQYTIIMIVHMHIKTPLFVSIKYTRPYNERGGGGSGFEFNCLVLIQTKEISMLCISSVRLVPPMGDILLIM